MGYIYTAKYYPALKEEEILSFVTTWVSLEDIVPSKLNKAEKDKYSDLTHIRNKR